MPLDLNIYHLGHYQVWSGTVAGVVYHHYNTASLISKLTEKKARNTSIKRAKSPKKKKANDDLFKKMRYKLNGLKRKIHQTKQKLDSSPSSKDKKLIEKMIKKLEIQKDTELEKVIEKTVAKCNNQKSVHKKIDLHGLSLEEAKHFFPKYLNAQIDDFEKSEKPKRNIKVITGKGNNSEGDPVLKPYIKEYLETNKIKKKLSKDGGAFKITLKNKRVASEKQQNKI